MTRPTAPQNRAGRARWSRFIVVVVAIVVVAAIYGTRQEMRGPQDLGSAGDEDAPRTLLGYFHAKNLPDGWVVGRVERIRPGAFVVNLHFSPRVDDPRYGRPAPAGAIDAAIACPIDPQPFHRAGILTLHVRTNDKSGVLDEFTCPALSAALSSEPDRSASAG